MIQSSGALMLSDTTPTYARSFQYGNTGLGLSGQFASYAAIYRAQLMVYGLVNKRALNTARLPLKIYERTDTGRVDARDSSYARLMRNPNPKHDPFFFWAWTSSTFDIYGEALWGKVRGSNGEPAELWLLHPTNFYTRRDESGALVYVFHLGSATNPVFELEESEVVHFKAYNPDTTIRGLSPLEALRMTLLNEDAARRASAAFWNNGARPSVVLSHPGIQSDQAFDRLKASWDAIHSGVDNFAKTAILEEGMLPHVMQLSAEESQYIQTRKLSQEECCIAYDMPPPAMHILDHATFSNITEQMRSVYRDTMAPHLGRFESVMDASLRPDFDDTGSHYAEFLMDEVMRGSFEVRMDAYAKAIGFGVMKPGEARAKENLPDAGPDSDRLFINSTIIPIDATSSRTSAAVPASDVPLKSLTPDELRTLMGRLSRTSILSDVDVRALTIGLNGKTIDVACAYLESRDAGDSVAGFKDRLRILEGAAA